MLALEQSEFTGWHWLFFVAGVLFLITLDLRVFHRSSRPEPFRTALGWTILWFTFASLFALAVGWFWSKEDALQFATGYLIELSLSMDNVFVMALIFGYFAVPADSQHRVLFFGIIGAMLLRGIMIWAGVELVQRLEWMLEIFGAFLAISGVKVIFFNQQGPRPEQNPVIKLARRLLSFSSEYDGQRFVTYSTGSRLFTPLALVLIAIETSDLVFALDSIPAIFGITQKPFLVFTSNVFAILGLRSLYFVLAGAIDYFRYLKAALGLVLAFIGVKMLIARWFVVPTAASLAVVSGIFGLAITASIVARELTRRESRLACTRKPPEVQQLR